MLFFFKYNYFINGGILDQSSEKRNSIQMWILAYGVLIGLIFAGVVVFFISPKRAFEIKLLDVATPEPIFVEVDGAVNAPGLFLVEQGMRVNDLIEMAGGFEDDANKLPLNLAMPVYDGMQIIVSTNKTMRSTEDIEDEAVAEFENYVNINFADLEELCTLPSIGESKANAILEYREEHGYFESIEAIMQVPGIGEGIFGGIENLITIY